MILVALALATAAPVSRPDPDEQAAIMAEAIEKLEAERAAATPAAPPRPTPLPYDLELDPTTPVPLPSRAPAPAVNCSGPLCIYEPIPDGRPVRGAPPPDPWHVSAQRTASQLWPILPAVAGTLLFWRYSRPRWRSWVPIGRRIVTGYWREIGLFSILAAILVKLW